MTINFTDIDAGNEELATSLRTMGFKWKSGVEYGVRGFVNIALPDGKVSKPQIAFSMDKNALMINGEEPTEFGVNAGIFHGIQQVLLETKRQTKKEHVVLAMKVFRETDIEFTVMPKSVWEKLAA